MRIPVYLTLQEMVVLAQNGHLLPEGMTQMHMLALVAQASSQEAMMNSEEPMVHKLLFDGLDALRIIEILNTKKLLADEKTKMPVDPWDGLYYHEVERRGAKQSPWSKSHLILSLPRES